MATKRKSWHDLLNKRQEEYRNLSNFIDSTWSIQFSEQKVLISVTISWKQFSKGKILRSSDITSGLFGEQFKADLELQIKHNIDLNKWIDELSEPIYI